VGILDECKHRSSCNANCPLYVTNTQYSEQEKVHCALLAIDNGIKDIQLEISNQLDILQEAWEYRIYRGIMNRIEELSIKVDDIERELLLLR
jgi:hypothetical protein